MIDVTVKKSEMNYNIFMENFDNTLFKSRESRITFWYRYVDDILAFYAGSNRELDHFLIYINNIHRNIKFTLEIEVNSRIIVY